MSLALTSLAAGATYLGNPLGIAIADSAAINTQLTTLTDQAADGKVSDSFAGLGAGMSVSLVLNPALASNQAAQNNIAAASGPMQVAQSALSEISSIASNFFAQTSNLNGLDPSEVDSIAASAKDALGTVANLLDSTYAGQYVFAGQDSQDPPVPNPDQIISSGFVTQIGTAVAMLGTNGATATTASTLAIAASNAAGTSPFSAMLSQPAATVNALRPSVALGAGESATTGIMASANADVTSTGTSTTGSYMRDILRGLATIASLSSAQVGDSGFAGVVSDVSTSLGNAITAINQDAGVMGDRQTTLTTTASTLSQVQTAMQTQLAAAQDVDMAQTLTKLSQVQTQLQGSYQVIAGLQSLSLARYLPA